MKDCELWKFKVFVIILGLKGYIFPREKNLSFSNNYAVMGEL
jgi:hypothetical protein